MQPSDDLSILSPENTPLFIGAGVTLSGSILHGGPANERAVILGELSGELTWNGIVQVTQGGKINATGRIHCRELVVSGSIQGDVQICAGVLRLEPTGDVQVSEIYLPSGGLEQARGSFITGRLSMSADHPFSSQDGQPVPVVPTKSLSSPAASGLSSMNFTPSFGREAAGPVSDIHVKEVAIEGKDEATAGSF